MVLNSKEAIQYIEARRHHHSGLDKFKEAMNELNNPQDELKSIHIGGTNGKGSSVDYLRSILNEAGYKIGTFTSPYLVSHHDRIRIDNHPISDERLFAYIKVCEKYFEQYDLSMFEIDMMIACLYFKDENVDFAIFEVGMGGRLDATNILTKPLVCGITNIGRDHMAFLGDTDEKIAIEKAGIIKENVDCIGEVNFKNALMCLIRYVKNIMHGIFKFFLFMKKRMVLFIVLHIMNYLPKHNINK